jgi:thiol:disulfide interchange protein DsbD
VSLLRVAAWLRGRWALLAFLLLWSPLSNATDAYLEPDQAFQLSAERQDDGAWSLHWQVADGYLLYRQRVHIRVDGSDAAVSLPTGQTKPDPAGGPPAEVYHGDLSVRLDAPSASQVAEIEYQGCADAGLCYLPQQRYLRLDSSGPAVLLDQAPTAPVDRSGAKPAALRTVAGAQLATPTTDAGRADPLDPLDQAGQVLHGGNLLKVAGTFLLFGVLLSLTPCVLPMVPILTSIIVGQRVTTRRRGLQLASAYALGMAAVYTALGIAAGLAGEGMAAYLQQPGVLVAFALLLSGLALSMFDVYTLQVPAALQTRLAGLSDRFGGGALGGAAAMGALSAVMVGPCVAAPLAGALLYIGRSHDVWLGGLALFSLACGMSVPLLVAGASAGSLLPRAGAWMNRVKHVFGLLLLAVAWWMVSPLVGASALLAGWGLLALSAAVFLGLHDPMPASAGAGARLLRTAVIALAVLGALELSGAILGARDPLTPLAPLTAGRAHSAQREIAGAARGQTIGSTAELDQLLASAGQPVLVDFYADWCVSCKEMERDTFPDPGVQQALAQVVMVRADVTANSQAQRALMKRFGLFGPPALVLFDAQGHELIAARLVGFAQAQALRSHLQRFIGL